MSARSAAVSLGLGAVFLAVVAASQVAGSGTRDVDWTVIVSPADATSGSSSPVEVVDDLRKQLREIRERLPGAGSMALAELKVPTEAELLGQRVPLDRGDVREALAYELILTTGRPLMPMLWMRRSQSVLPMIEEKLAAAGLPDDLKYVAMIESDLRETVRSPSGAAGLWQFIKGTGRRYGLRVDRYLDQRLAPSLATDAAIKYLSDLHDEFGDWFLALAAYNAGENKVRDALKASSSRSYFDLYLPPETRRYVHRVLAAKMITSSPADYGLVKMVSLHVPQYRMVEVQVRRSRADLKKLAADHGLDYSAIRLANPQIRSPRLPRGKHLLRIPITGVPLSEPH